MGVKIPRPFPAMTMVPFYPGIRQAHHPNLVVGIQMRYHADAAFQPNTDRVGVEVADFIFRVVLDQCCVVHTSWLYRKRCCEKVCARNGSSEDPVLVVVCPALVQFHRVENDWLVFRAVGEIDGQGGHEGR